MAKYKNVQPGEPLEIQAAAYNAFQAAARAHETRKQGTGKRGNDTPGDILVKLPGSFARFAVVELGAPVITPTDNEAEFVNNPVLECIAADAETTFDKFAILLEPGNEDDLVRAAISGVYPVEINKQNDTDKFARIGISDMLLSGSAGPVKILWSESGTGVKWAVVNLGVYNQGFFFGKVTAYTWGNPTLTVNPCDDLAGHNLDTSRTVTVSIVGVLDTALAVNDFIVYKTDWGLGVATALVNPMPVKTIELKATIDWVNLESVPYPNNSYITGNPRIDNSIDATKSLSARFTFSSITTPNLREDDLFIATLADTGDTWYVVSAYADDKFGSIKLWSGADGTWPAGWALCDGNNGTIDLTSKFVRGTPNGAGIGGTGGFDHFDVVQTGWFNVYGTGAGRKQLVDGITQPGPGFADPVDNKPPYYDIAYIQRVS